MQEFESQPGPFLPLLLKFGITAQANKPNRKITTAQKIRSGLNEVFCSVSLIQFSEHRSSNSVAGIYLLRLAGPKW